MTWESKGIRNLLDITHFKKEGKSFSESQDYEQGQIISETKLYLFKGDIELKIKPYTLEHFIHKIDNPQGLTNELSCGIKNDISVSYIGCSWIPTPTKEEYFSQYFFMDDKPAGYNSRFIKSPGWPLNHPAFIYDENLKLPFDELKKLRPHASESIWRCVALLSVPGPDYTGKSDEGSLFKLKKR